jgi:hypothetical protein
VGPAESEQQFGGRWHVQFHTTRWALV